MVSGFLSSKYTNILHIKNNTKPEWWTMHRMVDGLWMWIISRIANESNVQIAISASKRFYFNKLFTIMYNEHWTLQHATTKQQRWLKHSKAQHSTLLSLVWYTWFELFENVRMHSIGKHLDSIRMWKMVCISSLLSGSPLNHLLSLFLYRFHYLICVTKAKRMWVRLKKKIQTSTQFFHLCSLNKVRRDLL